MFHPAITFCVVGDELGRNVYIFLSILVTLPRYFQDVMAKQKIGEKVLEKWGFSK